MDLYGELSWRGLVYDATDGVPEALAREALTGYIGFDPSAASLHVGSLLQMLALARMQQAGHSPIALVGGGTGLIGDPKPTAERALLTVEQVEANVAAIREQLARFLDFDHGRARARLVDNAEWLTTLTAIRLMRDVGKHFSVNVMLTRESIRRRIEGEEGISYAEFSYALLQAFDFLELNDRFRCTFQVGGSDQWGNIVGGIDLIRRVRGTKAYGLVQPLITTATGQKFGKTETGTIWLDPRLTSPYEFYQFWVNVDDRDAVRYLKYFTFLTQDRIDELDKDGATAPEQRLAQRELAREVTQLVHGPAAVADAEAATSALFSQRLDTLTPEQIGGALSHAPSVTVPWGAEWPVVDLLVGGGVTKSKGEATRLIRGGGLYVNDRRLADEKARLTPSDAIGGRVFVVRKGKRDYHLIRIADGPAG